MSDVTKILSQIEAGDPTSAELLLPLVYKERRKFGSGPPSAPVPKPTSLSLIGLVLAAFAAHRQRPECSREARIL
ncbi:MAG: hypothetical protein H0T51_11485 [Pirellulales bacterium]|nr:hypothetical protein [Pirellulales bacterium]